MLQPLIQSYWGLCSRAHDPIGFPCQHFTGIVLGDCYSLGLAIECASKRQSLLLN